MEEVTYRLSYSCRDNETRNTVMDLDISFQNPTQEILEQRINTWLKAIGVNFKVTKL
jgi:hypothetical protein